MTARGPLSTFFRYVTLYVFFNLSKATSPPTVTLSYEQNCGNVSFLCIGQSVSGYFTLTLTIDEKTVSEKKIDDIDGQGPFSLSIVGSYAICDSCTQISLSCVGYNGRMRKKRKYVKRANCITDKDEYDYLFTGYPAPAIAYNNHSVADTDRPIRANRTGSPTGVKTTVNWVMFAVFFNILTFIVVAAVYWMCRDCDLHRIVPIRRANYVILPKTKYTTRCI
ncbi:b121.2 [miniopterid betaherpesvirus 1]|uniref:B121.2 n=1 Tax=miniopterid betaherpesvirus 1 TaxID=3070189 RepID=I3VQB3_9BETA|nr:b121.2 [miniopterid betaherpesvirus 1]AFK83957.1 b121.2 [miniopterid betaherpesvirus 1]